MPCPTKRDSPPSPHAGTAGDPCPADVRLRAGTDPFFPTPSGDLRNAVAGGAGPGGVAGADQQRCPGAEIRGAGAGRLLEGRRSPAPKSSPVQRQSNAVPSSATALHRLGGVQSARDETRQSGDRTRQRRGTVNLLPAHMSGEQGGVDLLPVALFISLCGGGEVRQFLPGVESTPHLLP
jgi:hypothetical protein